MQVLHILLLVFITAYYKGGIKSSAALSPSR